MIDRDIHSVRALLVEGNAMLRGVAAEPLHSLAIGHVAHTKSTALTARKLEARNRKRALADILKALAFYQGSGDEALKTLARAVGLSVQSKRFDKLSLLRALTRLDRGDKPGVPSMQDPVRRFRGRFAESKRLHRRAAAGIQRAGRSPGGLQLRVRQPGQTDVAVA